MVATVVTMPENKSGTLEAVLLDATLVDAALLEVVLLVVLGDLKAGKMPVGSFAVLVAREDEAFVALMKLGRRGDASTGLGIFGPVVESRDRQDVINR